MEGYSSSVARGWVSCSDSESAAAWGVSGSAWAAVVGADFASATGSDAGGCELVWSEAEAEAVGPVSLCGVSNGVGMVKVGSGAYGLSPVPCLGSWSVGDRL